MAGRQIIRYLTPEQDQRLGRTVESEHKRVRNPRSKRLNEKTLRGPDCYLIQIPVNGLKARDGDEIFGEDCDIVKFNDAEDELEVATDAEKIKVFNPYPVKWYKPFTGVKLYIKAFRHKQGQWLCEKPPYNLKVKPKVDINPGEEGLCTVIIGGGPTSEEEPDEITVKLDWMSGEEKISALEEATAVYREYDGYWEFDGAECTSVSP